MTQASATALAGTGLIGVAKDNLPRRRATPAPSPRPSSRSSSTLETGKYRILDYLGVADCGTVIHPRASRRRSRAARCRASASPASSASSTTRRTACRPTSASTRPSRRPMATCALSMRTGAVDQPDPSSPLGTKGIGEPLLGCAGCGAAVRDLRRARRPRLQPHAGAARHDPQPSRGPAAGRMARCRSTASKGARECSRDMMPHFELFQPDTLEAALDLADAARRPTAGCSAAARTASTGSRTAPSAPRAVVDLSGIAGAEGHARDATAASRSAR